MGTTKRTDAVLPQSEQVGVNDQQTKQKEEVLKAYTALQHPNQEGKILASVGKLLTSADAVLPKPEKAGVNDEQTTQGAALVSTLQQKILGPAEKKTPESTSQHKVPAETKAQGSSAETKAQELEKEIVQKTEELVALRQQQLQTGMAALDEMKKAQNAGNHGEDQSPSATGSQKKET